MFLNTTAMLSTILYQSIIFVLLGGSLIVFLLFLRGRFSPALSFLLLFGVFAVVGFIDYQKKNTARPFSLVDVPKTGFDENTTDSTLNQPEGSKETDSSDHPERFSEPSTTAPPKSKQPQDIPESYGADFPPVHPFITLRLEGLSDLQFKESLSKHMGFKFVKKKGDFVLTVGFTGTTLESNNRELGRRQYNYSGGSIVISIDGVPCIGQGNYWLPETHYEGYDTGALKEDLRKRETEVLMKNIRQLARDLKNCLQI